MFILTMKYKNSQEARRPPPSHAHPTRPAWDTPTACLALSFSTCCVFVLLRK